MSPKAAYVTLLTRTSYLAGTLVLDYGLRAVGSKYPLVVMVAPSLPPDARHVLQKRGIRTREIEILRPPEGSHAVASHDARFADTWTKLRAFDLIEYDRVVLLDCDMVMRRNMDELMDLDLHEDQIAAAHVCACNPRKLEHYPADWIPINCAHTAVMHPLALPPSPGETAPRPYSQLNSGTVVLNPSKRTFEALAEFLHTREEVASFSFPDQDLLATVFKGKWKPLPWYYNALKTLRYIHPKMWNDEEVRCVHYILPDKPWQSRTTPPESEKELGTTTTWWWEQFDELKKELMTSDPEGWKLVASNVDST